MKEGYFVNATVLAKINKWLMHLDNMPLPPEIYEIASKDASQFIAYLWKHKMLIYFCSKVKNYKANDQLSFLIDCVDTEIRNLKQITNQQRFHVMRLLQDYKDDYQVLKGVTSELLTGNDHLLRTSFDWDIWVRDPRAFTEYASPNGFLVDKESCTPHEFSKLF